MPLTGLRRQVYRTCVKLFVDLSEPVRVGAWGLLDSQGVRCMYFGSQYNIQGRGTTFDVNIMCGGGVSLLMSLK